jgi:molybdopterin-guanine dinucleotide biosynthesis protein A
MTSNPVNGLILAGGRSSRLGFDKSGIQYFDKPQPEHLAEILTPFCQLIFISCRKPLTHSTVPVLIDRFEMAGPLNAILTAFQHQPGTAWLTVPVDMPNIDADLIRLLIHHRNPKKMATCFRDSTGKQPEPLLAIWEPTASAKLLDYHSGGGQSPREFLLSNPIELLTVDHPKYLVNINTPQDLAGFRKKVQDKQPGG